MGLREILLHRAVKRADHYVGQRGEGVARLFGGDRLRQDARADQEHLLLAEHADAVEEIFIGRGLADRALPFRAQLGLVRQRAEESRLQQRIDHMRIARENVGKPRRGAENERDEADQIGILPQQR